MTVEITIVLAVLGAVLWLLTATRIAPDAILVAGLTALLATGAVSITDGVAGFANPGMLAVGALFVVVAGLRETGAVDWIASTLLGRPRSERLCVAPNLGRCWRRST